MLGVSKLLSGNMLCWSSWTWTTVGCFYSECTVFNLVICFISMSVSNSLHCKWFFSSPFALLVCWEGEHEDESSQRSDTSLVGHPSEWLVSNWYFRSACSITHSCDVSDNGHNTTSLSAIISSNVSRQGENWHQERENDSLLLDVWDYRGVTGQILMFWGIFPFKQTNSMQNISNLVKSGHCMFFSV